MLIETIEQLEKLPANAVVRAVTRRTGTIAQRSPSDPDKWLIVGEAFDNSDGDTSIRLLERFPQLHLIWPREGEEAPVYTPSTKEVKGAWILVRDEWDDVRGEEAEAEFDRWLTDATLAGAQTILGDQFMKQFQEAKQDAQ